MYVVKYLIYYDYNSTLLADRHLNENLICFSILDLSYG